MRPHDDRSTDVTGWQNSKKSEKNVHGALAAVEKPTVAVETNCVGDEQLEVASRPTPV